MPSWGLHDTGWRQGRRERALLERVNDMVEGVTDVPPPSPALGTTGDRSLSVLDGGWDLRQLLAEPSWLRDTIRTAPTVIAVAPTTVPGLRRLEAALELFGVDRTIAALPGPLLRKWPKAVTHSAGPLTRDLLKQGRFQPIPHDRGLAVAGLDSASLPPRLLRAAEALLALADIGAVNAATADHSVRRTTP